MFHSSLITLACYFSFADFGDGSLLLLGLASFPSDMKLCNHIADELARRYKNPAYFTGAYLCRKSMLLDLFCKLKRFDDFETTLNRIRHDRFSKRHDESVDEPHPVTARFVCISEDKLSLSLYSHAQLNDHLRSLLTSKRPSSFVALFSLLGGDVFEQNTLEYFQKQISRFIQTNSLPKVRDLCVQLKLEAPMYQDLLKWMSLKKDTQGAFTIASIMRDMGIELGMIDGWINNSRCCFIFPFFLFLLGFLNS